MDLKYDSKLGEVVHVTSIKPKFKFETSGDSTGVNPKTVTNMGTYAKVIFTNTLSKVKNISQLEIWGHAFLRADDNITVNQINTKNVLELNFTYLADANRIKEITKKLNEYYNKADFTFTLSSTQDYAVGSLVNVSELGIGSTTARITKRNYSYNNAINYSLEAIKDISFNINSTNETLVENKSESKPRNLGEMTGLIGTLGEVGEDGKPLNYWALEDLQDEGNGSVIFRKGEFVIGDDDNFIRLKHKPNGKAELSLKADVISISALGTDINGNLNVTLKLTANEVETNKITAGEITATDKLVIPSYSTDPVSPVRGQIWLKI